MLRQAFFLLFLLCAFLCADGLATDTLNHHLTRRHDPPAWKGKSHRKFPSIDKPVFSEEQRPKGLQLEQFGLPASEDEAELRAKIDAAYNKVVGENRFIEFLDASTLIEFPVGIKTDLGLFQFIILIDSLVMTPRESFLYASMVFQTPHGDLHFMGSDIRVSRKGGLVGDGKLFLVGDYPLPLWGDNEILFIKGAEKKTYVQFDCNGYKQLSLQASLVISDHILVPEDDEDKNVSADFTTTITDWGDLIIQASLPPFQIRGIKDVTFSVTQATVDLSDTRNPAGIRFPKDHQGNFPDPALWQGVLIREALIQLPPQFELKKSGQSDNGKTRISFLGSDLILDGTGLTGKISARELIPLGEGNLGNWDFSLEDINVNIVSNALVSGGFRGKIRLPITRKGSADLHDKNLFSYSAILKEGNEYVFSVLNPDTVQFDVWNASAKLYPASSIEIQVVDEKFFPRARLHGMMSIRVGLGNESGQNGGGELRIGALEFQNLQLQSERPYITCGSFSLGGKNDGSRMGGFPFELNQISGSVTGNKLILTVDGSLSLVGEDAGGFAARGRVNIISESEETGTSYNFKEITIDRFAVRIDKGPFKFSGDLKFYRSDPVFGHGISGGVEATFSPGLTVNASVVFGTKDGFRYWFADGLVASKNGIPVFPPLTFYSFGGGAYYHMRMENKAPGSPLGKTSSGVYYVPDKSVGLGFKAVSSFGVKPGEKAFQAEATYEMEFNSSGGVRYIGLRGNAYFLGNPLPVDPEELKAKASKMASLVRSSPSNTRLSEKEIFGRPEAGNASLYASLSFNYDFENRSFHGNISVFANIGGGVIRGSGSERKAGEAVLHFSPGSWYIHIGQPAPDRRIGLDVLGVATMDAYLVMGNSIPDTPPPPAKFSILGSIDADYMKDLNALSDGSGIGFGASFSIDTGEAGFLVFYGSFAADVGFDLMLKDYGETECNGSGQLGINGWYANGQAYAFFEGKIGIKITVFRKKKRIPILEIGAAVLAQAKLPNPTWMRGMVGGYFNVLGGLVKGNCKFEIEIGNQCDMIRKDEDAALESVSVLSQLTPSDNAREVDVFTLPQAVFNYEIEKEYEMVNDANQVVRFKIAMDRFDVRDENNVLPAELKWNADKTVVALNPVEILPSEKEITVELVTSFREEQSGTWVASLADGQALTEKHAVRFMTSKAPDVIPAQNVAYSYPSIDQLNYYKNEYPSGYIKLKQGQLYLFGNDEQFESMVRFVPPNGSPVLSPFQYHHDSRELRFSIPTDLKNEAIYSMELVQIPRSTSYSLDANVDTVSMELTARAGAGVTGRVRQASGTIRQAQEKIIYSTHLRVSRYNSFAEKIRSVNPSAGWRDPILENVHAIGSNISGPEPFSLEELAGSDRNGPLIQMEADLQGVPWFQEEIFPLVYRDYPILGRLKLTPGNRNPDIFGLIPSKAVFLYQHPHDVLLTSGDIASGSLASIHTVGRFDYYLPYYMYYDFVDLANQAANHTAVFGPSPRTDLLINGRFPYIKKGDYWINIHYVLPGTGKITSTYRHRIFNPID